MNIDYDNIETNEILDILNKYKKGTRFIITGEPSTWSSSLNNNSPTEIKIKYPYTGKIIKILYKEDIKCISMTDGIYGWSLLSLLRDDLINIDPQYIRKTKTKENK